MIFTFHCLFLSGDAHSSKFSHISKSQYSRPEGYSCNFLSSSKNSIISDLTYEDTILSVETAPINEKKRNKVKKKKKISLQFKLCQNYSKLPLERTVWIESSKKEDNFYFNSFSVIFRQNNCIIASLDNLNIFRQSSCWDLTLLVSIIQKQPPEVFCKKGVLRNS